MRRFFITTLVTILVLAGAGATGYWYLAEQRLEAGFAAWQSNARARGWQVAHGAPQWGGWPLHAALAIPDMTLSGGGQVVPGGIGWHAVRLVLNVDLAQWPYRLNLTPDGPETLRLGRVAPLRITAAALGALVPLQAGPLPPVDITGHDVTIATADAAADRGVTVAQLQIHGEIPASEDGKTLQFTASAGKLGLPSGPHWALGREISSLAMAGTINGVNALPIAAAPSAMVLAKSWRDAGGTLRIARLALAWGPLGLSLRGEARLDADLQPDIAAETRIAGYAGTLQALATQGLISPQAAGAAGAVLGLLAHTPPGGGAPEVQVPLRLKAGHLTVGGIPVLKVAPIAWQ